VSDGHYIEVTALIGPIDPPHKLHTVDDGVMDTEHGARAQRIFEAILAVDPDADVSANVVDEDGLPDDGEDVAKIIAERDRLRAAYTQLLGPAEHLRRFSGEVQADILAGHPGTSGLALAVRDVLRALDASPAEGDVNGTDRVNALRNVFRRLRDVEAERDRLRAVVDDALLGLRQLTDELRDHDDHDIADATARLYRSIAGQVDERRQLDVSPTMGDDEEEVPVVMVEEDPDDGGFIASSAKWPGKVGQGDDPAAALRDLALALGRDMAGATVGNPLPCRTCGAPVRQCIERWAPCCERCEHSIIGEEGSEPERSHRPGRAAPSPADGSELADDEGGTAAGRRQLAGWGVWHADDEEWIGFGVTSGLAAEMIPDDYEHLVLRPVVVRIEES
jgi:hypothetical protein